MTINSKELKENLSKKLQKACEKHLEKILEEIQEKKIFAYTIFCSSGTHMGIAIATEEGACKTLDSSQWDYVNNYYEVFYETNEYIDTLYEIFYDEELKDIDLDELDDDELWEFISGFLVDVVVEVVSRLKTSGMFNKNYFDKDLLLGINFGDPDINQIPMIEKSSKKLNSQQWHEKVSLYCKRLNNGSQISTE